MGETGGGFRGSRHADRIPAHFELGVLIDFSSQDIGNELRAEAYAQDREPALDGGPDQGFFVPQPGVKPMLIDIHGAAHDDQKIHGLDGGRGVAAIPMRGGKGVSAVGGPEPDLAVPSHSAC